MTEIHAKFQIDLSYIPGLRSNGFFSSKLGAEIGRKICRATSGRQRAEVRRMSCRFQF